MTAPIVGNITREAFNNVEHVYRVLSRYGFDTSGADDYLWPRIAEGKRRD